jgi:hypothetical protein
MIRTFTIVENRQENGNVEYSVSGDLPIEQAAAALVRIALYTEPQKKEKVTSEQQLCDYPPE